MFRLVHLASANYGFVCTSTLLLCLFGKNGFSEEPSKGSPPAVLDRQAQNGTRAAEPRADKNVVNIPTHSPVVAANAVRQAGKEEPVSDAKRFTDLQRGIEADQQALQTIEADLANPESDYRQAEAEFTQLDSRLEELKKAAQAAQDAAADDDIKRLTSEIEKLQPRWKLAKERFDLAIQERKTIQEKTATLKQKIQQNQQTLDKLRGTVPAAPPTTQPRPAEQSTSAPAAIPPEANGAVTPKSPSQGPATSPPGMLAAPATVPTPPVDTPTANPATPTAPAAALTPTPDATTTTVAVPPPADKPARQELIQAMEDAEKKQAVAQEAEKEVQSVVERMELLRKDIQLEQQLLTTTRKKADIAFETERQLQEEYENRLKEGAESTILGELRLKLSQARQRFSEARGEARERVNRIDELQSRLSTLQSEEIVALQEADRTRLEAESAKKTVDALRNPFTARNILQWLIDHGPRIVVILVSMLVTLWTTRIAKRRFIDVMVKHGGLGKQSDRENRARTLVSVFENAARVAIVCGGTLMILDTVGAPITTLMGGAAVFGLAIAFGAQSLIKDYFYGFMILLEQQYTINDVIKIGDIAGQVERITLRVTVLRDLEGRVHFIPHGTITATTNMTHGWSRALFEIGVAYKENADRVIDLIKQLGKEMRNDPLYGPLVLEDLTMLGVDAFNDSAIMIKFFIKTRPLKQWEVKRELLRRIKNTFDEQGIEIPFPHRTVYHRQAGAENLEITSDDALRVRKSA